MDPVRFVLTIEGGITRHTMREGATAATVCGVLSQRLIHHIRSDVENTNLEYIPTFITKNTGKNFSRQT